MVQFDKPSGRGNSGIHKDFKDGNSITSDNLNNNNDNNNNNNISGFNSMSNSISSNNNNNNNTDTKSMTSRQSNYKNVPTDQMRSMSSMMMMGKNTITTSIPISDWKDLKYSKKNSQTFFSTPGKVVQADDLRKNGNENNESEASVDRVEETINATQHLTISNNNKKASSKEKKTENYNMKSACVTTDFSMQNVLMQMGLNVISVDGMLIRYYPVHCAISSHHIISHHISLYYISSYLIISHLIYILSYLPCYILLYCTLFIS